MKNSRRRFLTAALSFTLVVAACGDDDAAETAGETTDEGAADAQGTDDGQADEICTEERVGGKVVALTGSPSASLDPLNFFGTGGYGGDLGAALYGSLLFYNAETDEYEPYIAESWEPNDDRTEWTVTLRDDATFGNGDPFTADHVARWYEVLGQGTSRGARLAGAVTTEVVDDQTIIFRSDSGFNLPFLLSADGGWVPNMDLFDQRGDAFARNPLGAGAGAFEFQSISDTAGESLVLVAKDDWWGGPVCIERLEFRNVQDPTAAVESFLNGEADTLYLSQSTMVEPVREAGLLAFSQVVGSYQWVFADQGVVSEDSPFKDVRILEALQLALDYDVIYQRLADGEGPEATSAIIPEESPYYVGAEGPPSDPERARQLVQETIEEGVWDGSFTYLHRGDHVQEAAALVFEAMWEAVGMDVTLEGDPNQLTRTIVQPDFEVSSLGFAITPPHPYTNLSNLTCDRPGNRTGYCDPEMDEALLDLRAAITIEENAAAIEQIQEIWNETFPYAIFDHTEWGLAAQEPVQGLRFGSDNTAYYDQAFIEG